ncbi:hypothetical protein [Flexithrix dorotheae]|uniref:hypothetical protein n=1 Tax=Flexithrix dorotheae TaxID=70993 RepID=UPI0012F829EE|nr:hypothetical protein [Flexithrix dorotheae]
MELIYKNKILGWIIFFLACPILVYSQSGNELQKKISKTFDVSKGDKLNITNKFGEVKINTWNEPRITVEVEIKVWGPNDKVAQNILNEIEIIQKRQGDEISFRTSIQNSGSNRKSGFEINYAVNMPPINDLILDNRYGATYLADFRGNLILNSAYGSLKAGKITGNHSDIKVSYGKADIEELFYGKLKSSYCSYVELGKVGNLKIDDKHGRLEIEEGEQLEVESAYSNFNLGRLTESIFLDSKFGNARIENVMDGFKIIDVESSYGSLVIELDDAGDFEFEVDVRYGSFNQSLSKIEIQRQIIGNTSQEIAGIRGNGGNSIVKASSAYGNVKFN